MFSRVLFLLLAATLLGPATASAAQNAAERRERDPVAALERWTARLRRNGPGVGLEELQLLGELVADVRMLHMAQPERREQTLLALLDLAGVRTSEELRARRSNDVEGTRLARQTERIRDFGREALGTILTDGSRGELADWLALRVLSRPREQNDARRIAALRLMAGWHQPSTLLAIFACAREQDRDLREAALDALVGWQDDAVHRFMLRQLERGALEPGWISRRTVQRHFATGPLDPASRAGRELFAHVSRNLLASDWRQAFHAIQLLTAVRDDPAVPSLIEALTVWIGRSRRGRGSRRIESELQRELELRSGRRLGRYPERWASWWKAVGAGAVPSAAVDSPAGRTRADFFGLRPVTDRVVFVLDRSRSMAADFGTEGNTRYAEAIEQMMSFLRELGPQTRFRVLLFSDELEIWKDRLQPATESNLSAAERWMRYSSPQGGTYLRPAIERVLRLGPDGSADLSRIEEDSVVVLCDGKTAEGHEWVQPLLERSNDDACLAFHCIQIGRVGDQTLETLATGSGGDFVEVEP